MKNIIALSAAIFTIQSLYAQGDTHLKLSNQYPAAGENIVISYDPTGTPLDGKNDIAAIVYCLDDKENPAADIDLQPEGEFLKGNLSIPISTKAFFVKISSNDLVDDNNNRGYIYLIYNGKQPVEGAYASEAKIISGLGNKLAKIGIDGNESAALLKKEFVLYPQSEKEYKASYYLRIARDPAFKDTIAKEIVQLEKSTDEKDLMLRMNLLRLTKRADLADSLNKVIEKRFPEGLAVKNDLVMAIMGENDVVKKDSLFNIYLNKFPETAAANDRTSDNIRAQLAAEYSKQNDLKNYYKYERQIKNKALFAETRNNTAWNWAVAGNHLNEAEKFSKQSLDWINEKSTAPSAFPFTSPKGEKLMKQNFYNAYADTYAYILLKENRAPEALKYMEDVSNRTSEEENSIEHYMTILAANGQYEKAVEIAEKGIKAGHSSIVIKEELKKDYIKIKTNDQGYDQYLASLERQPKIDARNELAKTMIQQPAPVFALKDFDGKLVSLKDLKGKVVVVDFWATWCGPCKASFPGMQMAVDKFKNNPNVKFLFVDTWEKGDNYIDLAKKFIVDNKYTFHVLIDEKGDDGRQSKIVDAFGVNGIPTKFIIDKNGDIRFKYVGYSGTPEKVVDEVSDMIELASKPKGEVSTEKANANK